MIGSFFIILRWAVIAILILLVLRMLNVFFDNSRPCPYCRGKGYTRSSKGRRVACEFCNGKGKIRG